MVYSSDDIYVCLGSDPFRRGVVELATSSSDRRTKVAACELLHSLVLFMVGRGATQVAERSVDRRHCMALLFKKVFPAIMQLACDVDQVGLINKSIQLVYNSNNVSVHLYRASCSAHQTKALPLQETQREESNNINSYEDL